MRVLVVFYEISKNDRNTIGEHLSSFKKYSDHEFLYLNAFYGVPNSLLKIKFDIVLYHYTFLSQKWNGPDSFALVLNKSRALTQVSGLKVAMPQDEYVYSNLLNKFFKTFGVEVVFTCLPTSEWEKVYPFEKSGVRHFFTTFTGYIDDAAKLKLKDYSKEHAKRTIDIGYRARNLPFWLGRHGAYKGKLTSVFQEHPLSSNLVLDLSNDEKKVFKGFEWYNFLLNCRVVLGCEGGASLHDPDGSIRLCVEEYTSKNKKCSFEEAEASCFPGKDGNLELFAISPRHFEACLTKTCQVLLEGSYNQVFIPGRHYIELKKDFSNLDDVYKKIQNVEFCEEIAENAYADIVMNGKHYYSDFVKDFFDKCETLNKILSVDSNKNLYLTDLNSFGFQMESFLNRNLALAIYHFKRIGFPILEFFKLIYLYRILKGRYVKRKILRIFD